MTLRDWILKFGLALSVWISFVVGAALIIAYHRRHRDK